MVKDTVNLLADGFARPEVLWLLFLLPLGTVARYLTARRRKRALQIWLGEQRPGSVHERRQWLVSFCRSLGLALLIIGCAGPQWGRDPDVPRALGRDIWIVLDVSRSMLAENPSRLERAKQYVRELAEELQRHGEYRLGLIAFAGQAKVLCPLTDDYNHFYYALKLAHPDRFGSAGRLGYNDDGSSFGTSLRAALNLAAIVHEELLRGYEQVVLITDGDDLAGNWQPAIARLRQTGMAVHVLGVGDAANESRIPSGRAEEPFLFYVDESRGRLLVMTRRHDEVLEAMTSAVEGVFQREESVQHPLVQWFEQDVKPLPAREWTDDRLPLLVQRYGWFFGAALALFIIGIARSEKPVEDRP
jgi:Ca-activated chloride channel family protein